MHHRHDPDPAATARLDARYRRYLDLVAALDARADTGPPPDGEPG